METAIAAADEPNKKVEKKISLVKSPKLHASRCKGAEFERLVYRIVPEHGTPYSALFDPSYWSHIANQLRPTAILEVIPDGMEYYAQLFVKECDNTSALVQQLAYVDLDSSQVLDDSATHRIEWAGPHAKWRVVRVADRAEVKRFETKEEAGRWLSENKK